MSRKMKNKIFNDDVKLKNKCRKNKIKKIGKKVVFTTLTATMLINVLPFYQSSVTLGKVFAEEERTEFETSDSKSEEIRLKKLELNNVIDKISDDFEMKIREIASNRKDLEIKEDIIYDKLDEIADNAKRELVKLGEINIDEIKTEFEKNINELLSEIINTYHLDSRIFIEESKDGGFKLIDEKLISNSNTTTKPTTEKENGDNSNINTINKPHIVENNDNKAKTDKEGVETDNKSKEKTAKEDGKSDLEKLKEKKAILEKMKAKALEKALFNKQRIRIAGRNRRETALGISRMKYNSSNKIILVSQDSFADSLTASVLAEKLNIPILLTDSKSVSPEVLLEMQRLKTKEVLILGGESAISKSVEEKLKEMKLVVERLSGSDRYETSALVAEKVYKFSGHDKGAIIASGENYPDALSIAPVAARDSQPILLVKNNEIPKRIEDVLVYNSVKNVTIVGGEKSISDNVEKKLKTRNLTRISGKDRYDTALKIATEKFREPHLAYIATGEDFADALTAGPVAATTNAPILLVSKNGFTKNLKTYIDKSKAFALIFLGGEAGIPKAFEDKLAMIGDEKSRAEAEIKLEKARIKLRSEMEKITILKAEEKEMILKEIKEASNENDIKDILSKFKKYEDAMKKMIATEKDNKGKNKIEAENKEFQGTVNEKNNQL